MVYITIQERLTKTHRVLEKKWGGFYRYNEKFYEGGNIGAGS